MILTLANQRGVGLNDDIRAQFQSVDIATLGGGDRPVSLRQLLSHTTGASQSGYPGYPREYDLPIAVEVITRPPRFFESALVFDGVPGEFRYSGGGYVIAQLWAEDISGKPFASLADELILKPLGMDDSTFASRIDETDFPEAQIIGADAPFDLTQGVFSSFENSWHDYPELAAAGLWATSEDYARFASALVQAAGGSDNAIPTEVAKAMIEPQVQVADGQAYGLGVQLLLDDSGSVRHVSHSGANAGYRALFAVEPRSDGAPPRTVVSLANVTAGASLNQAIVFGIIGQ